MSPQVWIITGAARGLGRTLTELILKNGDIAIATSRNTAPLIPLTSQYPSSQLLVIPMDVSRSDDIKAAFKAAVDAFGRIDVVFNNAGSFMSGEAEAVPEEDARKLFDVNYWGATNVTLESVRVFREINKPQGGRLITISSATGFAPVPGSNYYAASKFAIEGFTEALRLELDPAWNIKMTVVAPGGFATGWEKGLKAFTPHPAYTGEHMPTARGRAAMKDFKGFAGDPVKAAQLLRFKLAEAPNPPKRFAMGSDCYGMVVAKLKESTEEVEQYKSWSFGLNLSDPPLDLSK